MTASVILLSNARMPFPSLALVCLTFAVAAAQEVSYFSQVLPAGQTLAERSFAGSFVREDIAHGYVFGGQGGDGNVLNDLWDFDMLSKSWKKVTPLLVSGQTPSARAEHAMVEWGTSSAVVFGGRTDTTLLNDFWSLTFPSTPSLPPTWRRQIPTGGLPSPRKGMQFCGVPNKQIFLMFGGVLQNGLVASNGFFITEAFNWSPLTLANQSSLPALAYGSLTLIENRYLVLFGGAGSNGLLNDHVYIASASDWLLAVSSGLQPPALHFKFAHASNAANAAPSARMHHIALPVEDSLVIFGGQANNGAGTNSIIDDLWALDLEVMVWTRFLGGSTKPIARAGASPLLWKQNGTLALVGGMQQALPTSSDTQILSTSNMQFQTLTASGAGPSARHSSVSQMIAGFIFLLGGFGDNALSDIWQFNTVDSTWAQMSTPAGVSMPATAYSASIRFGGHILFTAGLSSSGVSGQLLAYHPNSNSLASAGAPLSPLINHTMSLLETSGKQQYRWGGYTGKSDVVVFGGILAGSPQAALWVNEITLMQAGGRDAADKMAVFDGVLDFVETSANMPVMAQITVSMWMQATVFDSSYQGMLSLGGANQGLKVSRCATLNTVCFTTHGTSNLQLRGSKNINDGLWHHITVVLDSSSKKLYVDGVLDGTVAYTYNSGLTTLLGSGSMKLSVGLNPDFSDTFFRGYVDDVKVWNTALSASQIASDMFATQPPQSASLQLWLNFNSDSSGASMWSDSSSNGRHVTAGGTQLNSRPGLSSSTVPLTSSSFKGGLRSSGQWRRVEPAAGSASPPARYSHVAASVGTGRLFIHGGVGASGSILVDAWQLELTTSVARWTQLSSTPLINYPMHGHICIPPVPSVSDATVYLFGDVSSEDSSSSESVGIKLSLPNREGNVIEPIPALPSLTRGSTILSEDCTTAYMFGGRLGAEARGGTTWAGQFSTDAVNWGWSRIGGTGPPGNFWPTLQKMPNAAGVWDGETLLTFGGWDATGPKDEIYTYNIKSKSWTDLTAQARGLTNSTKPGVRAEHAFVAYHGVHTPYIGQFILFGGETLSGFWNDMYAFNPRSLVWTLIQANDANVNASASNRPGLTAYHSAIIQDDYMYSFGGISGYGAGQANGDIWRYHFVTGTWTKIVLTGSVPGTRWGANLLLNPADTTKGVIFGGQVDVATMDRKADVHTVSLTRQSANDPAVGHCEILSAASSLQPTGRRQAGGVMIGSRLVIFGGQQPSSLQFGGDLKDAWSFDISSRQWQQHNIVGPLERASPAMISIGNSILMFGGVTSVPSYDYRFDLWSLNFQLADPVTATIEGQSASSAIAGSNSKFTINVKNMFGEVKTTCADSFSLELFGQATFSRLIGSIAVKRQGEFCAYEASYLVKQAGRYTMSIKTQDTIIGSAAAPVEVDIRPSTTLPRNTLIRHPADGPPCSGLLAGDLYTFTVVSRDAFSNRGLGGDALFVSASRQADTVVGETGGPFSTGLTPFLTDRGDGTYSASLQHTRAGNYTLNIMIGSVHVSGSPFTCEIKAAAVVPSVSRVFGPGLTGSAAGVSSVFYVQTLDKFGNNITDTGSDEVDVVVEDETGTEMSDVGLRLVDDIRGLYQILYYPFEAGKRVFQVTVNDLQLPKTSPVAVEAVFLGFSYKSKALSLTIALPAASFALGFLLQLLGPALTRIVLGRKSGRAYLQGRIKGGTSPMHSGSPSSTNSVGGLLTKDSEAVNNMTVMSGIEGDGDENGSNVGDSPEDLANQQIVAELEAKRQLVEGLRAIGPEEVLARLMEESVLSESENDNLAELISHGDLRVLATFDAFAGEPNPSVEDFDELIMRLKSLCSVTEIAT